MKIGSIDNPQPLDAVHRLPQPALAVVLPDGDDELFDRRAHAAGAVAGNRSLIELRAQFVDQKLRKAGEPRRVLLAAARAQRALQHRQHRQRELFHRGQHLEAHAEREL